MSVQDYLAKMKNIQENLLEFLDSDSNIEDSLHQFTIFLKKQNIQDQYLVELLHLISNISERHYRKHNLIGKIENILTFLKDDIMRNFTSTRLFDIFQDNNRILLFLFEEQFITINEHIYSYLKSANETIRYFEPELTSYLAKKPKKVDPSFAENRLEGENPDYICKLIRNDSVEEFITYVNKTNLSLSKTKIKSSIFETNQYLKTEISLIEYSAFFGSIQIFKYLLLNKVELEESLWEFVIYSNNPELIYILEENNIKPHDYQIERLYNISIKCYNNEIAKYIEDNYVKKLSDNQAYLLHFRNYDFLPKNINDKSLFSDLCKYDYLILVSIMINDLSPNELNQILFYQILNKVYFFKQNFLIKF